MFFSCSFFSCFFFNDPATTEIYTLSLHDALPILRDRRLLLVGYLLGSGQPDVVGLQLDAAVDIGELSIEERSEEHTSELQSRPHLVCRLLLEKKKKQNTY